MVQNVEIKCGAGGAAYTVKLTGNDLGVFQKAAADDRVKGKEGEALVAAILAAAKGGISKIERWKDGRLNDGANGEPAVQEFNGSGTLAYAMRYKNGISNDGANGEPAFQRFNDSGTLIAAERYRNGHLLKTLDADDIAAYREALAREKTVKTIMAAIPGLTIL